MRLIWLRVALSVTVVGTASAVGLGLCLWWLTTAMHALGPMAEARAIVVPHGTTAELTDNLAADGLIERKMLFRAAVWLTRTEGALHAAEFAFPAHASVYQVLEILRSAKPVEHLFTIAEGLTARQIQGVLAHAEAMTGEVRPIEEGSLCHRPTPMNTAPTVLRLSRGQGRRWTGNSPRRGRTEHRA